MPVVISLLRGVNVGGHNKIKMDALRMICESLDLRDAQTYVQSGNVVFRAKQQELVRLQKKIQEAIAGKCGFRPEVVLRSLPEWKAAVSANPFARRPGIDPARLLVMFLAGRPSPAAAKALLQLRPSNEELKLIGSELFIYYPRGLARPEVPWTSLEKILQVSATGRNWNTVEKLLEIAVSLEQKN
jgi:uncharacterized protein (DUF1697 family)